MYPHQRFCCAMSVPPAQILPDAGCSRPLASRKIVDFPQPDAPMSDTNSPRAT